VSIINSNTRTDVFKFTNIYVISNKHCNVAEVLNDWLIINQIIKDLKKYTVS